MQPKKYLVSIISIFCSVITIFAIPPSSDTAILKSSGFILAYNSSLIYPGFQSGIEIPRRELHITRIKKNGKELEINKERNITINLSFYHHPAFHNNLYLTTGLVMRRLNRSGLFAEFEPEIGISRTFLDGTTYQVNDNGDVSIEKGAGYFYALLSAGGGIGYDFEKTKRKPCIIFSKFNILMMFPYNSTIYLRPSINIGIIYKTKHFINSKTRVQFRKK